MVKTYFTHTLTPHKTHTPPPHTHTQKKQNTHPEKKKRNTSQKLSCIFFFDLQKDEESHRNGHRSKDSRRREHRREDDDNRHRSREEHRGRHGDDGRSRDRHRDRDRVDDKSQVRLEIKQERERYDEARRRDRRNRPQNPFENSQEDEGEWGGGPNPSRDGANPEQPPKDKPNFETSGKLTEDTNTFRGVVIKYNEPPEARVPKRRWRFYVFKGQETLPVLHLHRQSAYLLGRDRKIADMPVDHPSCSKQHAVLQYRLVEYQKDDGTVGRSVRPYIIDLESSNGTFLNNKKIEPKRYYELQEKDVLKFGFSTREYVLLHANSKGSDEDDFN